MIWSLDNDVKGEKSLLSAMAEILKEQWAVTMLAVEEKVNFKTTARWCVCF